MKALSKLMNGISYSNHADIYYYRCFHSSRTEATLKYHFEPYEYNYFCNLGVPEKGKNVIRYKPGSTFFCKKIRKIAQGILDIEIKSMQPLSREEQELYDNGKYCYICKKVFGTKKNQKKVRDHDHYTGKFRGTGHSICNSRHSMQIDLPVFFHNRTNYYFNLLIEEFAKEYKSDINCILLNTDKYMSFSVPIEQEVIKSDDYDKKST